MQPHDLIILGLIALDCICLGHEGTVAREGEPGRAMLCGARVVLLCVTWQVMQ